jgi:phosphoenolpyruvate synthase/pyruvate phosphate dikinase
MAADRIRALAELRRSDEQRFGAKSASLGELIGAGVPVPPGFAVAAEAYLTVVEGVDLTGDAEKCTAAIRATRLPGDLRDELAARYGQLATEAGDPSPPVAVRSSAIGEDSEEATFAGQQETFLWVRGIDQLYEAVRDCWASLYSPEAVSYRAEMAEEEQVPAMGVTVQLMVDAAVSGVMFTCNPLNGDPSTVAVNASWGLGLSVVGGEVTPDEYRVSKVTREVLAKSVGPKEVEYLPDPSGSGATKAEVPAERQNVPCLDEDQLGQLADVARKIESHFGGHQDIEWAIAREREGGGGELFMLQSRPVTVKQAKAEGAQPARSAMDLVMGTFGAGKSGSR